ncbi:GmrSD restriction endonuclease domain-containing protein [Dysgonomonas termitidis]|uniref:DUF262 domain-containing protein n=1 Tax=Dysgonomonas termitidis TaxID=1516126 RepID=A0ABV9KSQ9_9BACT
MSDIYTNPISFNQLFTQEFGSKEEQKEKINVIEIPIIQRDYAQGRETSDVKKIRRTFLDVLFDTLINRKNIKLDFVYGDITNGKMTPLDGQQRLTTLFLLHWYIAYHEDIEEINFLSKFTYRTRFSSRDFCSGLVSFKPDFSQQKISEDIIDQPWFMGAWSNDPTIVSMLVVIDEIHNRFKNTSNLWSCLADDANPAISFYFLPIKEMGLTDSLYIKMNSRGKPLTPFEHFKANFEKLIKAICVDLYNEFIFKIDNNWTDILWKYRGENNIIDDEFMKYYRYITEILCYQHNYEIVDDDFVLSEIVYGINCPKAKYNLRFLFNALDCWEKYDIDAFFESLFSSNQYEERKVKLYISNRNLFLQCCNDYGIRDGHRRRFTLNFSLLLYAVLQFQMNRESITLDEIFERLRIVRNLVFNSSDEIREERMNALLQETSDIIVKGEISLDSLGYSRNQKEEEIYKMEWRRINPTLADCSCHLEDHFLLQGTLRIIDIDDIDNLQNKEEAFFKMFDHSIPYMTISRALLTIGDYSQLFTGWRFSLGNTNDSTWKDLFSFSNQRKYFENTKDCLNKLLIDIDSELPVLEQLESMITAYKAKAIYDWRYYFIAYEPMRAGDSGMYYWENDRERQKNNAYEVIMMNTPSSLSGRHWYPFLLDVYWDGTLHEHLLIGEYGDPLYIKETGEKIYCKNEAWEITNEEGAITTISIPQDNGIDIEDRLIKLKNYLISYLKL